MIVKLDATYHEKVMRYLKKEPEFNLFIIGDIEKYGYDNYFLNVWADINRKGNINGILLKYFELIIFYADKKVDLDGFCKLENGKLLKNNRDDIKLKKIRFGNINKIVKLYETIDEFENTSVEGIKNGLKSGRGYCIEINKQVVAMAKSTSESKTHAMIVGVGTHPQYRNRGLATRCIVKICSELINENKIPCLFYDNKEAGKIYKKLGFKEIGNWSIYYKE